MDPVMSDLNQKIGGCFSESMCSVFSMLTGRDFTIKPLDGETVDHDGIAVLHQATVVYVKAHYTKGMMGTLIFALPLKEGTMLVDLMLGGDGTPSPELAGDSRDALAETFNQIMGSANQALSDLAGETLSISNVEIFSGEGGDATGLEEILGPGPFYDLPLDTSQESLNAIIHVLIPDLLVQQIKRKLGMGEPPPPPPPTTPLPEDDILPDDDKTDSLTAARDLEVLLAHLPDRQPAVMRDVPLEGLSLQEAAGRRGMTLAAVKVTIHRALKVLQSRAAASSEEGE